MRNTSLRRVFRYVGNLYYRLVPKAIGFGEQERVAGWQLATIRHKYHSDDLQHNSDVVAHLYKAARLEVDRTREEIEN